jgi:hypothetical protein
MAEALNRDTTMRKNEHHIGILVLGGLLAMLLAGCAANVGKSVRVSDEQRAKFDALSVTDAIAALEKRVAAAKQANMPFFAPNYFLEASEALSEAQKSVTKKPKNELIGDVAKGDAILDKGEAMMAIVQNRFAKEIELKGLLDKFNAAGIYPKEYEKVTSELSSLIEKVELEKADKIDKDKDELIKAMQALDIKTVQYTTLHASDVINIDTKSKNGEKQAPATLAVALEAYKYAENRIAQAPHEEEAVQRAGEEALFAARHARYVNEQVVNLQTQFKVAVEPIVLQQEKQLLDISNALGQKDLRDQPIDKQAAALALAASQLVQAKEAQAQPKVETKPVAANEQIQALEKKLKEANDALEQANGLIAARDAQIKMLNVTITSMDSQTKAPVESKPAEVETPQASEKKAPDAPR